MLEELSKKKGKQIMNIYEYIYLCTNEFLNAKYELQVKESLTLQMHGDSIYIPCSKQRRQRMKSVQYKMTHGMDVKK